MFIIGTGLILIGLVSLLFLSRPVISDAKDPGNGAVPVRVNFPAPSLELQDLHGEQVSLDDYEGYFILVNNWATWCPPCRAEMPTLQAYYNKHRNQGFTLVAIESGDPPRQVVEFTEQFNLTFPIWIDLEMKAIQGFRNQALPSSYLINKSGMVILAWSGAINQDNLEKYVTPLLED